MALSKQQALAQIISHTVLTADVHMMVLSAPEIARVARPGQFVHVRVSEQMDPLLRRPFGIAGVDAGKGVFTIIFRVLGRGTELLALLQAGNSLDCLGPLGKGFATECQRPLLVGGGMGLAPLLYLAAEFCPRPVDVVMGGRTKRELFWQALYQSLCDKIHLSTDDGSVGTRGLVTDILPDLLQQCGYDQIYACGPKPMMAAVAALAQSQGIPCQISLEDHMACGVGACLSCTCAANDGKRRKICSDGPVFWAEEVVL